MSEQLVTIDAVARESFGKGVNRKMRRDGMIPATLMDKGKSTHLSLNPKLLGKAYKEGGKKFNLNFSGKTSVVEIKELQIDVIKRLPLHVDLMFAK